MPETMATLIAADRLDETLLAGALHRLSRGGLAAAWRRWVDEGSAADLSIDGDPAAMRDALAGWEGVDLLPRGEGPREKRLLVADMDSTMIGQECIDELADYAGFKPQVAAITERAMRGELDFAAALAERVALLAGLDEAVLARCLDERITTNPGADRLVATMRRRGATTLLVSGGFTAFVAPIAARLGFSGFRANVLEVADGRLTGRTTGPLIDSAAKERALHDAADGRPDAAMAIGDGANDGPMVVASGWGVAYRAKPALVALADARLDHHGLDALLWGQGIARADWAEADDPA